MLLEIRDGSVSRQGQPILSHFSFYIKGTEKIAIVGRNGAGKTTLLQVLSGALELDHNEKNQGSGLFTSRKLTVSVLSQMADVDPAMSVEDYVLQGLTVSGDTAPGIPERSYGKTADDTLSGNAERVAYRYSRERFDYEQRYLRVLTGLGLSKEDLPRLLSEFSGGEQVKIRLIRQLLTQPDVLILDEPTNHLDIEATQWLEKYLQEYPKAVVIVSHDRYFIDKCAEVVWDVEEGRLTRYPGNYTAYRQDKAKQYEKQRKAWERQQEEIKRNEELIAKFKNKARKAAFARSRGKILERMQRIEKPAADNTMIHVADLVPLRLGSKVVYEAEELQIGYEKDKPLLQLDVRLRRGQKIGIIGPNGSGKSTFLRTVAGLMEPLKGKGGLGQNLDIAYFDQHSSELESDQLLIDWFHDRFPALTHKEVRDVLAGFLFTGEDMGKQVSVLSGGEKARLILAEKLQNKPNFLLLDEPTNNMDIPAKEALENILRAYKGTLLFVSHDRYFLSRVADALLVFPEAKYYPFNYEHYRERQERALELGTGEDAALLRSAEEQYLIEGLKAVPKGERHRLKELSTDEAYRDWKFSLNRDRRHAAEDTFAEKAQSLEIWESTREETEKARQEWTKELLDWYDIYLETTISQEE